MFCLQDWEYFQQMQIPNQNISTYLMISWKEDTLSLWDLTKLWNETGVSDLAGYSPAVIAQWELEINQFFGETYVWVVTGSQREQAT